MRILGHVDRCDANRIDGWIFSPDAPDYQFSLEIVAGGEVIGAMHAGHFRGDLKEAGLGNGFCAFLFDMPKGLSDAALSDIQLRVIGSTVVMLPDAAAPRIGGFRSRFGGLWTDRSDWVEILGERQRRGRIDDETAQQIFRFARDGYVVLPGAVPPRLVATLNDEIERAWSRPPAGLLIETLEPAGTAREIRPDVRLRDGRTRLLDFYAVSETARRVAAAPAAMKFIAAVLDDTPKAYAQSILHKATGAAMTKDSATAGLPGYPLQMVTSWLALEDIAAGAGELNILAGSHHAPEYLFAGRDKSMTGHEAEADAFAAAIAEAAKTHAHRSDTFIARTGDLLIRHADLAYGDAKVTRANATRRAVVTNFIRAGIELPKGRDQGELRTPACVYVSRHTAVK